MDVCRAEPSASAGFVRHASCMGCEHWLWGSEQGAGSSLDTVDVQGSYVLPGFHCAVDFTHKNETNRLGEE